MKKIIFSFLVLIIVNQNLFAQNDKINPTTQVWSEADFAGKISKKWKWQMDLQYARQSLYNQENLFQNNSQLTFRPWLHFYPTSKIRISMFAGLWYNYPITTIAREYPEYRSAIQFNYYTKQPKNLFVKRIRFELRDIKDRDGKFETVIRNRMMYKYQRLLRHVTYDKHALYFIAFDEFFINFGSHVTGFHVFDQNRLFFGFGYNLTDDITFETGYFNQFQQHNHDANFDMNHIWQITLFIDNVKFR